MTQNARFFSIREGVEDQNHVLRITDNSSLSPLEPEGFTAPDPKFSIYNGQSQPISSRVWRARYPTSREADLDTRIAVEDAINHITGGWDGYRSFGQINSSNYISTSGSLEWAIWEIVRRLRKFRRDQVGLTVIRYSKIYSRRYKGSRAFWFEATKKIMDWYNSTDEVLPFMFEALNFARASKEILFYGRVFQKDINSHTTWTTSNQGFMLPEWYFIPKKRGKRGGWLNRLVWDIDDDFATAIKKLEQRRVQIERSRRV